MYELMILGPLSRRPMHGYMIAKIVGHIIGPFRQMQWGALYPVLNRLVRDGLIQIDVGDLDGDADGRSRKVYAITTQGRQRLRHLLMDTEHHLSDYSSMFALKVPFFIQLTLEERLRLCRHYAVHAQQHIEFSECRLRDMMDPAHPLPHAERADIIIVMEHTIGRWTHERSWAEQLIQQQTMQEAV